VSECGNFLIPCGKSIMLTAVLHYKTLSDVPVDGIALPHQLKAQRGGGPQGATPILGPGRCFSEHGPASAKSAVQIPSATNGACD